ncbi:MAG: outer membrane lipid asymmetry maintenance protein MlaD [Desulfococcaceae bacterium]
MKRGKAEIGVGIFMVIGLVCVGYLTIQLGKMKLLGDNHYPLTAKFQSVAGLKAGAEVVVAGVPIGQVDEILLDPERMVAVVQMKIQKEIELTDDSIASVKTAGLIGDKYIRISPGGSPVVLEAGDQIIETESAVDLEDLISKYVFGDV